MKKKIIIIFGTLAFLISLSCLLFAQAFIENITQEEPSQISAPSINNEMQEYFMECSGTDNPVCKTCLLSEVENGRCQ